MAPALDVTVELDRIPADGAVVKNVRETIVPGGKGLNVARYLAVRGAEVVCGGVLAREGASYFEREMARFGIQDCFARVAGEVRRNEMVVMPGRSFKLNRPAYPGLPEFDLELPCEGAMETVAILSGSLPVQFQPDYYARIIDTMRARGFAKIVLDASGEALRLGIAARPDVIKPNAEECAEIVGFELKSDADFVRATEILHAKVPYVIISDGAKGAWFNGRFVPAPEVDVRDTTAAGDTLLAEFCFSGSPEQAVTAGSMACTVVGSEPPCSWIESIK